MYLGIGDPNLPTAQTYAVWKKSVLLEQIAKDGPVDVRLSQQWIVYAYALWEEEFRPRLVASHGCAVTNLKFPLLGDLRRLPNDVVHHGGIATANNTGKCEALTDWFQPDDTIYLAGHHFADFVTRFPWTEMTTVPPS